jgi:pyrroline-5-carboxylate reductase
MSSASPKLGVIGVGAMGRALVKGLVERDIFKREEIVVTDADDTKGREVAQDLGVIFVSSNAEAARGAETIVVAVKPNDVGGVLGDIFPVLSASQLVISIAAGVSLEMLECHLPAGAPVVRVMPNTPALVGSGAAAYALGTSSRAEHAERVNSMLSAVGIAIEVPERLLDAVTGLSGSGPAYVYMLIEALADAGVSVGLPRSIAASLAAQTVLGAARMVLETGEHPAKLRDAVTSPGGTTIAGVAALEKGGFRSAIIDAVQCATKRSRELGNS